VALNITWNRNNAVPNGDGLCGPFAAFTPDGQPAVGGGGYLSNVEASLASMQPQGYVVLGRPVRAPVLSIPAPDRADSWLVVFEYPGTQLMSGAVAFFAHTYVLWED